MFLAFSFGLRDCESAGLNPVVAGGIIGVLSTIAGTWLTNFFILKREENARLHGDEQRRLRMVRDTLGRTLEHLSELEAHVSTVDRNFYTDHTKAILLSGKLKRDLLDLLLCSSPKNPLPYAERLSSTIENLRFEITVPPKQLQGLHNFIMTIGRSTISADPLKIPALA